MHPPPPPPRARGGGGGAGGGGGLAPPPPPPGGRGGGRGGLYVAALDEKEKTRRHAQTGTGRDILLQLREAHAEGSRTHYLAGPGTHWINQQKCWRVKNKAGPQGDGWTSAKRVLAEAQ
jgi:hypothetical protein